MGCRARAEDGMDTRGGQGGHLIVHPHRGLLVVVGTQTALGGGTSLFFVLVVWTVVLSPFPV